jgi:hypothetical protein
MRKTSQVRQPAPASAKPGGVMREADLDQVAASGGPISGGTSSGGGSGGTRDRPLQSN